MEDKNQYSKIIKFIKYFFIILIVAIILIFSYYSYAAYKSEKNFKNYLEQNNFSQNRNIKYVKTEKEENKTITYSALSTYVLSKSINTAVGDEFTNILLDYEKNGNIKIDFTYGGINKNNVYAILYQTGNYKNGKFDCKMITENGHDSQCDKMKNEAKQFEKEALKIFDKNNINPSLLKLKEQK